MQIYFSVDGSKFCSSGQLIRVLVGGNHYQSLWAHPYLKSSHRTEPPFYSGDPEASKVEIFHCIVI